ncbi:MAG TPA: NAD(P)-dependent oxidoreductase, partial [Rubricoccaceae bacterium]|nr:NAD(P)-dependent oxidoreductase [Rubricoccaceae bacterium]
EKAAVLERAGARPMSVDLFDAAAVRAAVAGQEAVVNVATHIPPTSKAFLPWAWKENDRIRREASQHLVEAALAAGAGRFVQESFAPMYPDRGDAWIDEAVPVQPAPYSRSTVTAEEQAHHFTRSGGAGVVLRFGYFYGPEAGFTRDTIESVRKGRAPVFGAGEGFISSIHLEDAAAAVLAALDLPAGTYNVVEDEPLRRRAFFDALAEALGVPPPKFLPAWLASLAGNLGEQLSRSQRISNRKLREASGWAPKYPSVREGWPAVVTALGAASARPT